MGEHPEARGEPWAWSMGKGAALQQVMYSEQRVTSGKVRETITKQREARTKHREVINNKGSRTAKR